MPTGMRPPCRANSVSKFNPTSTSPNVDHAPSRRLTATVAALAIVAVVAGTRAVIVSKTATKSDAQTATPAPVASINTSFESPVLAAPSQRAAVALTERAREVRATSSESPTRGGRGVKPSAVALAPNAASGAKADATVRAAAIAQANDAAPTTPPVEAPVLSVPTTSVASGPVSRGQPAAVAFDWRMLLGLPGVTIAAEEITDASSGSAAMSGAHALRTHSNFELTLDLEKLIGVKGLTVYAQHKSKTGRNGSGEGSFVQNFSNIDADDFRAFGEVFVEQRVLDDRVRVKAGRLDFNTEFAGTDHGGTFLNASMGFSPSIVAAPTFPLPTEGANVFVTPRKDLTIGVGVFNGLDGAPAPVGGSSRFEIAQASQQWAVGASALAGRVAVGAWRHTGMFASVDAAEDAEPDLKGTRGWYATVDQTLWQRAAREGEAEGDRPNVAMFAQLGRADSHVRAVNGHMGGGLTFTGVVPGRSSDAIGLGVTRASWSGGREMINEVFYQLPLTSHLSFVGDVQHVNRRDLLGDRRAGLVSTLRTIVSF